VHEVVPPNRIPRFRTPVARTMYACVANTCPVRNRFEVASAVG
jgi:hypothetical protein